MFNLTLAKEDLSKKRKTYLELRHKTVEKIQYELVMLF